MRYTLTCCCMISLISLYVHADEESALGAIPALSGSNNTTSGVVLPQNQLNQNSRRLSPVLVVPPESLDSRTLVVPLPSEGGPPVVIRGNKALEVTPSIQPAMPQSKINGKTIPDKKPALPPVVD